MHLRLIHIRSSSTRLGGALPKALMLCALVATACSAPTPVSPPPPSGTAVAGVGPAPTVGAAAAPTKQATASVLTVGIPSDLESGDPFFAYSPDSQSIKLHLFDSLVEQSGDGPLVAGLAESWRVVDETTLEFALRHGVKFTNGEDFNADSAKFSIDRYKDPAVKAGSAGNLASIENTVVLDPYTVRLNLSKADAALPYYLTLVEMLPPGYLQQVGGQEFAVKPVGTGPYKLTEWARGDHLTLQANDLYWSGSPKGKPASSSIIFKPIPDPSTRIAALKSGQVQIARGVPGDVAATLDSGDTRAVAGQASILPSVLLDTKTDGPLKDARVRRALNYAVDVESIMKDLLKAPGKRLPALLPSTTLGFDAALQPYTFDVAKAKSLLAEAGYANGFSIDMDYSQAHPKSVVEAIQAYLGAVGVKANLTSYEHATYNQLWLQNKQAPVRFSQWGNAADPSGTGALLVCSGALSRYCNAQVDDLWKKASATYDVAERGRLVTEAERIMHDDAMAIFLYPIYEFYGVSAAVTGFQPPRDGRLRVSNVRAS